MPTCSGIRIVFRQNRHRTQGDAPGHCASALSAFGLTCAKLPAFGARFHNAAAFAEGRNAPLEKD
jgi:hypothetical protein